MSEVVVVSEPDSNEPEGSPASIAGDTAVAVAEAVSDAITEVAGESIDAIRALLDEERRRNATLQMELNALKAQPQEITNNVVIIEETPEPEPETPIVEGEPITEVTVVEDDTPKTSKETTPPPKPPKRRPWGRG